MEPLTSGKEMCQKIIPENLSSKAEELTGSPQCAVIQGKPRQPHCPRAGNFSQPRMYSLSLTGFSVTPLAQWFSAFLMLQPFCYSSSCCADPNYKIIFVAVSLLLIWIKIKYLCFPMVLDDSWKGQGCPTPKGSYPTVEYHCSRPSMSVVNLLLLQEA